MWASSPASERDLPSMTNCSTQMRSQTVSVVGGRIAGWVVVIGMRGYQVEMAVRFQVFVATQT